jgi:urocanate hydratase
LGLCFRKTGGFTKTDTIACQVLEEMAKTAPIEIQQQMQDNIQWIKGAQENKLVVGSQANSLCRCRRPCENRFRF